MKLKQLLITVVISTSFMTSCTNNKKIKELQKENELLKQQIKTTQTRVFAYCIITANSPNTYSDQYGNIDYTDKLIASEIKEFLNFDEDVKYKFLDESEAEYLASNMRGRPVKIIKRECLTFNSYAEASKDRSSKFK